MMRSLASAMILMLLVAFGTACAETESTTTPPTIPDSNLLVVTEPANESIISTDKIKVAGITVPGAVVSVNGSLASVNDEGKFTAMVVLEEGPNIIGVIASDLEGNQESRTLVLIYVP